MSSVTDFRVLRSQPEIEAFFWRIAPFIDAGTILASVEMGPALTRIGSFDDLVKRAGANAAVEEIIPEIARQSNGRGLPQLILLPNGWVAMMAPFGAQEEDDKDSIIRAVICPAEPDHAPAILASLAQVLLGLRDSVGAKPGRAPLTRGRDHAWPAPVTMLFDRDAVEAAFKQLAAKRKDEDVPRLSAARRDVIEPHIRWFAENRKADDARKAAEKRSTKRPAAEARRTSRAPVDLKLHIINMRHGELSDDGYFQTTESDVTRIANEARDWINVEPGRRLVVYAHGGLVSEEKAVAYAQATVGWWMENEVYPVFCVWESDAITSILQLVREALGRGERGPLDWTEMRDAAVERLVHALGQSAWDVMKRGATRCSADGLQFGLTLFAAKLKASFGAQLPAIDLVGHSAGSIVLLSFLARLRAEKIKVDSFQTLAPAATCRLYSDWLAAVGDDKLKTRIYAMQDRAERDDNVAGIYGKSLLYLVSRGFEAQFGEPISGLQKDLLADRRLVALLCRESGGVTREAMVFSPTPPDAPKRLRSGAIRHGAFDNDPETMWSVMALIRGVGDAEKITEFPHLEDGQRGGGPGDLRFDLPEEVRTYLDLARSGAPGGSPTPSMAPSPMPPAQARQGRKLALTIGINDYATMNRLAGCVNDSDTWRDLLSARGFHVTQFTRPDQLGRDQITRHLRDLVGQSAPGDTLIWQFSGHGMEIEGVVGEDSDAEASGVDQAIVAANASETQTGQLAHAIMDDELHAILQGLNPQADCYVFLDSCFSGTATRFSLPGRPRSLGTLRVPSHIVRRRSLTAPMNAGIRGPYDGSNHVLFSACSATQTALENGAPPQGCFTRAVSDLLRSQTGALTNAAFCQRINDLIPGNDQTSGVYCDPARRELVFPLSGL